MKTNNVAIALTLISYLCSTNAFANSTVIQNVRVFDGEKILVNRNV